MDNGRVKETGNEFQQLAQQPPIATGGNRDQQIRELTSAACESTPRIVTGLSDSLTARRCETNGLAPFRWESACGLLGGNLDIRPPFRASLLEKTAF